MNKDDASRLAVLFMQTWRGGPALPIWEDILADYNHAQAEAAYRKLRDGAERTPTIPDFRAAYRSLTARHEADGHNGCHYCDGHGWTSTTFTAHDQEYSASDACTNCTAGKDAKRTVDWCNRNDRGAT